MNRDPDLFPEDDTGDALWEMQGQGDDLSKPREVEFSVVFTEEEQALKFGRMLLEYRQKTSLADDEEDAEYPFEITLHAYMLPTYDNIKKYEALIEEKAESFNGHYDGWGCFSSGGQP